MNKQSHGVCWKISGLVEKQMGGFFLNGLEIANIRHEYETGLVMSGCLYRKELLFKSLNSVLWSSTHQVRLVFQLIN